MWLENLNNYLVAYGTAFMLEAVLVLVAMVMIGRLHIENAEALQQEQRESSVLTPAAPVLG